MRPAAPSRSCSAAMRGDLCVFTCGRSARSCNTQYAAMKGDLKMVITGGNEPELFNVELDPAERRTIAAENRDELKAMEAGLKEWLATESEASKQRKKAATTAAE